MTDKYKTINGKIRHAHAPVGEAKTIRVAWSAQQAGLRLGRSEVSYESVVRAAGDVHCGGCGYHVCSCPPKPKGDWVYNREMDMLVYEEETRKCNLFLVEAARAHIEAHKQSWAESYRSIMGGSANSVLRGNITISLPEDKDEPLSDVWPEDLDDDSWDDE